MLDYSSSNSSRNTLIMTTSFTLHSARKSLIVEFNVAIMKNSIFMRFIIVEPKTALEPLAVVE